MALIGCPECKKDISDKVKSCPHCGYPLFEENDINQQRTADASASNLDKEIDEINSDFNNGKKIFMSKSKIISTVVGVLLVVVTLFSINNNAYGKFKNAMKNGNTSEAIEIFNEIEADEDKEKIINYLNAEVGFIYENYQNDKISFEEASSKLKEIESTNIIKGEVTKNKAYVENLQRSRVAYNNTIKLFEDGKFKDAIMETSKVIKSDKNYDAALEYKKKAKIELEKEIIGKAKELASKNDYTGAIDLIEDNKSYVENKKELGDIANGYKIDASMGIINDAKEKYEAGYIDEAIAMLKNNVKYSSNNNIQDELKKANEIKTEHNKNLVLDIKNRITINYDEVKKQYLIAPKGYSTRYVNIGRNVNIEPRMTFDSTPFYTVCIGYQQSDWIFFDKVIFSIGEARHQWDLDYFSRGSEVIFGGDIAEWYLVGHSELLAGYDDRLKNLTPIMDSIINSDNAVIRFQGNGYRDHTITSKEKQTLKDLWTLYKILEEDSGLFDILK